MTPEWAAQGPSDDDSGKPTVPAFIEFAPDSFKPVSACTADELRAAAQSRILQAEALMAEAERLESMAVDLDQGL